MTARLSRLTVAAAGIQYYILGNDKSLSVGNSGKIIVHPTTAKVFNENKDHPYPLT